MKSEERVDYEALKETGAFGFSNDGCGVQTAGTMYLAMKAAAEIDMPIVAHVEDNSLLFGGVMNAGKRAEELGLPGILGISESSQIARDLCWQKKPAFIITSVTFRPSKALSSFAWQNSMESM